MKITLFFILLTTLVFGGTVGAVDGVIDEPSAAPIESNASQANNSDTSILNTTTFDDTAITMTWPAIPGESLNDIARLFYPKSATMRRQFVAETLRLNTAIEPKLKASNVFKEPTLLQVPTLKSLSKKVRAIKASNRAKANRQKMNLSYRINEAASKVPAFLLQEYELLLSKNAFLKAELERLQVRLGVLQDKLTNLKLVFDKTLSLPVDSASSNNPPNNTATNNAAIINLPAASPPKIDIANSNVPNVQIAQALPTKKVFKNLTDTAKPASVTAQNQSVSTITQSTQATESLFDEIKYGLIALLGAGLLVTLGAYLLKKRQQRMFAQFSKSVPNMDDTLTDFGGQWQDTEQETDPQYTVEFSDSTPKPTTVNGFLNTEMRDEQAKATSTLEEAKLLMSINRTQDAIAHLKLTIETQPKSSINHWLYLLEIFRKLNLKQEFEAYAQSLHQTFNVMTPVWYETIAVAADAKIIVAQHLEEFPHIMQKIDTIWPSELAKVYLRSLITDNRDGERTGFSKSVLDEILMLIALIDTRKDFD